MHSRTTAISLAALLAAAVTWPAVAAASDNAKPAPAQQRVAKKASAADDLNITATIRAILAGDRQLSGHVQVRTSNSVVELSGIVNNPDMRQRAQDLAMVVDGVKAVRNNIQVKAD